MYYYELLINCMHCGTILPPGIYCDRVSPKMMPGIEFTAERIWKEIGDKVTYRKHRDQDFYTSAVTVDMKEFLFIKIKARNLE